MAHHAGVDISSLLIAPVQRCPRYALLLKELIKHTPEAHADYPSLLSAQVHIKHVCMTINEAKRAAEQNKKMTNLAKKFSRSDLLNAGRGWVEESRQIV